MRRDKGGTAKGVRVLCTLFTPKLSSNSMLPLALDPCLNSTRCQHYATLNRALAVLKTLLGGRVMHKNNKDNKEVHRPQLAPGSRHSLGDESKQGKSILIGCDHGRNYDGAETGTRTFTTVPARGSDWIEMRPFTRFSRSCMLMRPRPRPCLATLGSNPTPKSRTVR